MLKKILAGNPAMRRRVCLALPTNRECPDTITLLSKEADYAVRHFDVEVYFLILDTCDGEELSVNRRAVHNLPAYQNVTVMHLDRTAQSSLLHEIISRAGTDILRPEQLLSLMLPDGVSYGACTNRAFLFGSSLGCDSVHRRDSDSRYQMLNGALLFPIHQELLALGQKAGDTKAVVSGSHLDPAHAHKPVSMAGASFIGEMSVDIEEIYALDPEIYHEIVSLWAPPHCSPEETDKLVKTSFRGAGRDPFIEDYSLLSIADPMKFDMCNISFYRVHEDIPLPPASDTIGSDYFLMYAIECTRLPAIRHNRHIINFYTPGRKTDVGFKSYHLRLTKFFLSMLYFQDIYRSMAEAGEGLLDSEYHIRLAPIIDMARHSMRLDQSENERKLRILINAYRKLGGRYAEFAGIITGLQSKLLLEACQDIGDFCLLMEAWPLLIKSGKEYDLSKQPQHQAVTAESPIIMER